MKILETMTELALRDLYPKILEGEKIDAIGRPRIEITKLAAGSPLGFKITTAVYPKFALPDYRALAAPLIRAEPTTKDKRRLKIMDAILAATAMTLPTILLEAELDQMLQAMKVNEKTETQFRTEWRAVAEKRVKTALILKAIAAKEQIAPPAETVEAETKLLLEYHPKAEPARVRSYIVNRLVNEEVFRFLESPN